MCDTSLQRDIVTAAFGTAAYCKARRTTLTRLQWSLCGVASPLRVLRPVKTQLPPTHNSVLTHTKICVLATAGARSSYDANETAGYRWFAGYRVSTRSHTMRARPRVQTHTRTHCGLCEATAWPHRPPPIAAVSNLYKYIIRTLCAKKC